jgi:cellobiose phosphorylase
MVVVPAALVHGIMGISTGWKEITVAPALPRAWHDAKAAVMWMGRIYDISISYGTTSVSRRL